MNLRESYNRYFNTSDDDMFRDFIFYYKDNEKDQTKLYSKNYDEILFDEKKRLIFKDLREMSCGHLYYDENMFYNLKDIISSKDYRSSINDLYIIRTNNKEVFKKFINSFNNFVPIKKLDMSYHRKNNDWLLFQRQFRFHMDNDFENFLKQIFNIQLYFFPKKYINRMGYKDKEDMVITIKSNLLNSMKESDEKFKMEYLKLRYNIYKFMRSTKLYKVMSKIDEYAIDYDVNEIATIFKVEEDEESNNILKTLIINNDKDDDIVCSELNKIIK